MNTHRGQSWMWAEACALLDQAERRQRRFYELLTEPSSTPAWEPPVNVFSAGAELQIEVALPGARHADVVVKLTASGLTVDTTVAPPTYAPDLRVLRMEIPYGRMRRRIDRPPGRYALREHRLENGLLFLRLTRSTL